MKTVTTTTKTTKTKTKTKTRTRARTTTTIETTKTTITTVTQSGEAVSAETTSADWEVAVQALANTPLATIDIGALAHELIPGTNGIDFDKTGAAGLTTLGKAYVTKNGDDWTEEWFVEDEDFFLNFGPKSVAEIKFETTDVKPEAYPGTAPKYASLQFQYRAMPSQSAVDALPTPPKSDYQTVSIAVYGKPSVTTTNPAETGWMFREINTAKSPAVITEHWVLSANYKAPSNGYASILLKGEGTHSGYTDLEAFMTKMNDVRNGANGWAYVQVSFSLTQQ